MTFLREKLHVSNTAVLFIYDDLMRAPLTLGQAYTVSELYRCLRNVFTV
jgi:hypothetical protein